MTASNKDDYVKQNDSPAEAQSVVTKSGNLLSSKPDAELTPAAGSVGQSDAGKQGDVRKAATRCHSAITKYKTATPGHFRESLKIRQAS